MKIDTNFLKKKKNSCYKDTYDSLLSSLLDDRNSLIENLLNQKKSLRSNENDPKIIAKIFDALDSIIEGIVLQIKELLRNEKEYSELEGIYSNLSSILTIYSFILEPKINKSIFASKEHLIDLICLVDSPKILSELYNTFIIIFSEENHPNVDYIASRVPKLIFSLKFSINHINTSRFGKIWNFSSFLYDVPEIEHLKSYIPPNKTKDNFFIYQNKKGFGNSYDSKLYEGENGILEIDLEPILKNNLKPSNLIASEILQKYGYETPSPAFNALTLRIEICRNFENINSRMSIVNCSLKAMVLYNLIFVSGGEKISNQLTNIFGICPDFPILLTEIIDLLSIPAPKEMHINVVKCLSDLILVDHSFTKDFLTEIETNSSKFENYLLLVSQIKIDTFKISIDCTPEINIEIPLSTLISDTFILEFLGLIKKTVKSLFIDDDGNPEAGTLFLLTKISKSLLSMLKNEYSIMENADQTGKLIYYKPYSTEVYLSICDIIMNLFTNHYISSELDFMTILIQVTEKELIMLSNTEIVFEPYDGGNGWQRISSDTMYEYASELFNIIDSPFYRRVPARAQLVPTMARKISDSKVLDLIQPFFFKDIKITEKLFVYTMILAGDICREIPSAVDDLIDKNLFQSILKRLFEIEYPSDSESYPMIAYLINMLGLSEKGRNLELEYNAIGNFFCIFLDRSKINLLYGDYPYPLLKTVTSLAHEFYEMSTTVELLKDRLLEEIRNTFEATIAIHRSYKKMIKGFANGKITFQMKLTNHDLYDHLELVKQAFSFIKFFSKLFLPYSALSEKLKENGCIDYLLILIKYPTINISDFRLDNWILLNCVKTIAYEGRYSRLGIGKLAEESAFNTICRIFQKIPSILEIEHFNVSIFGRSIPSFEEYLRKMTDPNVYKVLTLQAFGFHMLYVSQFIAINSFLEDQGKKTVILAIAALTGLKIMCAQTCYEKKKNIDLPDMVISYFKKFAKTIIHGIGKHSFNIFTGTIPFYMRLYQPSKYSILTSIMHTKFFFGAGKPLLEYMKKNPILMIHMDTSHFYETLFKHIECIFSNQVSIEEAYEVGEIDEKKINDIKTVCTQTSSILKLTIGIHLNSSIHNDSIRAIQAKILKLAVNAFKSLTTPFELHGLPEVLCSCLLRIITHEDKPNSKKEKINNNKILEQIGFPKEIIEKSLIFKPDANLNELCDIIANRTYDPNPKKEDYVLTFESFADFDTKMTIPEYNEVMIEQGYSLGELIFQKLLYFVNKGRNEVKKFIVAILEKLTNESKKSLTNAIIYTIIGSLKYLCEEVFDDRLKLRLWVKPRKEFRSKIDFKSAFSKIQEDKVKSLKEVLAIFITFYEFSEQYEPNSIKGEMFGEFLKIGLRLLNQDFTATNINSMIYILFICQRILNKKKNEDNSKQLVRFIFSLFEKCIGMEDLLIKRLFNTSIKLLINLFKRFPQTIEFYLVGLKGLQNYMSLDFMSAELAFPSFVDSLLEGEKIGELALKYEISRFFNISKSSEPSSKKRKLPKSSKRSKDKSPVKIVNEDEKKLEPKPIEEFIKHFNFYANSKSFLQTVKSICQIEDSKISLKVDPIDFKFPKICSKIFAFLVNTIEKQIDVPNLNEMDIEIDENSIAQNDSNIHFSDTLQSPKCTKLTKKLIISAFDFILSEHPELFHSLSKLKSRQGNNLYEIMLNCVSNGDLSTSSCINLLRKFCKESLVDEVIKKFINLLQYSKSEGFYNLSSLLTGILDISIVAQTIIHKNSKIFMEIFVEKITEFLPENGKIYDENLYRVSNPLSIILQYMIYFSTKKENLPVLMPKDALYNSENIVENWNIIMGYSRTVTEIDNIGMMMEDEDGDDFQDFNQTLEDANSENENEDVSGHSLDSFFDENGDDDNEDHNNSIDNSSSENHSSENSSSSGMNNEDIEENDDLEIEEFDSEGDQIEIENEGGIEILEEGIMLPEGYSEDEISLISSTIPFNIGLTFDNFGNNRPEATGVYNQMVEDVIPQTENRRLQIEEFNEADVMEVLDESDKSNHMFREADKIDNYNEDEFKERLVDFLTKEEEPLLEEEMGSNVEGKEDIDEVQEIEEKGEIIEISESEPINNNQENSNANQNSSIQEEVSITLRNTLESLGLDENYLRENSLDISFLNSLPAEFQHEILDEHLQDADDEPLEEFMNALDPSLRRQVESQNQFIVQSSVPLTNVTFLNALPERIRREIIESASAEFLGTLPNSLLNQYGKGNAGDSIKKEDEIHRSELVPQSNEMVDWLFTSMHGSNQLFTKFPFGMLRALLKNDHNYNYFMNKAINLLIMLIEDEKIYSEHIYEENNIIANDESVKNLVSIKILTLIESLCQNDLTFFYQDNCWALNKFILLIRSDFVKKNSGHLICILSIANMSLKNSESIVTIYIAPETMTALMDTINIISGTNDPILLELSGVLGKLSNKVELFEFIHEEFLQYSSFLANNLTIEIKNLNIFEKEMDRQFCSLFRILTLIYQDKKELKFKLNDFLEKPKLKELWETLKKTLGSYRGTNSIVDRFVQRFIGILENFFILHKLISQDSAPIIDENSLRIYYSPDRKQSQIDVHPIFFEICEQNAHIINLMARHNLNILSDTLSLVVQKMPRILSFDNKRSYFKSEIKKLKNKEGSNPIKIRIRRSEIFLDSFHHLRSMTPSELKGKISVEFAGEEAVDVGGVTREWFLLLSREIFNPNYALFKPSANGVTFIPSENSHINSEEHLSYFKFIGRIIAKALHDNYLLDCFFSQFFYKHILSQQLSVRDMEDVDPEFYKNLKWILENNIEDLEFTFSYERNEFGSIVVCDLIENGRTIAVKESNKSEYVLKLCEAKMIKDIEKQIQSFLEGFYDIIPKDLIKIFDFRELELMISGLPDIDIQDLKKNTEYTNYNSESQNIKWLWEILEELKKEDRANFIQFVTGTSKVPLEGFKALKGANGLQKFQVHKSYDTNKLPTSHTCFNQLDLADYGSKEILESKLLLAIQEGKEGFGFA